MLDFILDPFLRQTIYETKEKFVQKTMSVDLNYVEDREFNKGMAKKFKISPDSLMQLALQVKISLSITKSA